MRDAANPQPTCSFGSGPLRNVSPIWAAPAPGTPRTRANRSNAVGGAPCSATVGESPARRLRTIRALPCRYAAVTRSRRSAALNKGAS